MIKNICYQCQEPYPTDRPRSKFCDPCNIVWGRARANAGASVMRAVKNGALVHPTTLICPCGERASVYDHRDYSKPLEVEAVCDSCNLRRGRAARLTEEFINRPRKKREAANRVARLPVYIAAGLTEREISRCLYVGLAEAKKLIKAHARKAKAG